jgi:excinuclease ABC subunit C
VIQQLRNEAHRFGIEHHRNRRSKDALTTELETIPGIGEQTVIALMKQFKSVKRISEAKFEDLQAVVGTSKANKIFDFYHTK